MHVIGNGLILILLFLVSYIDIRERRIPNAMLIMLFACVMFCRIVAEGSPSVWSAIAGSVSVAFFLLMLTWIRPGAFGLGDVKLMFVAGAHLGIEGAWNALVIGSVLAAVFCVGGLWFKKITLRSAIPFGPFLCFGVGMIIVLNC